MVNSPWFRVLLFIFTWFPSSLIQQEEPFKMLRIITQRYQFYGRHRKITSKEKIFCEISSLDNKSSDLYILHPWTKNLDMMGK